MFERTIAACTGCENAGTLTVSTPRYCEELETSFCVPPELVQRDPCSSGSSSIGERSAPQMTLRYVLASELRHWFWLAHSTGKLAGGALLDQLVGSRPDFVSWNETVPVLVGAESGFSSPSVVQSRVKLDPTLELSTVTFSFVTVGLYALSDHW
jgi:hypothetical protein